MSAEMRPVPLFGGGSTLLSTEELTDDEIRNSALDALQLTSRSQPGLDAAEFSIARSLTAELTKQLGDVDPDLLCRIILRVSSTTGALYVAGVAPVSVMNITAKAALMLAGHVPGEQS